MDYKSAAQAVPLDAACLCGCKESGQPHTVRSVRSRMFSALSPS